MYVSTYKVSFNKRVELILKIEHKINKNRKTRENTFEQRLIYWLENTILQ